MSEKVGVTLVVENYAAALSQVSGFNKALLSIGETTKQAASAFKPFDTAISALATPLGAAGRSAQSAAGFLAHLGGSVAGGVASGIVSIGEAAASATVHLVKLGVEASTALGKLAFSQGKESLKLYSDFSQVLSQAGATSGLSGQQLEDFNKKAEATALDLGQRLPVSAKDAAESILELTKAGFSANDALAAAEGTAKLSTAANLKMGDAAGIVSNAINQFGLSGKDANMVVDLLAKTANASAVDVKDLSASLNYAGPIAKAAGFSIQDVNKALGVLGNAGIKGTSAGTGLRTIMQQLVSPSDKAASAFKDLGYSITDNTGQIKPLQQQMVELRDKFSKLDKPAQLFEAQMIAGKDHMSKFLAIMNASPESFNAMSDAIDNADGTADKLSEAFTKTLAGSIENMKGSIETLQIKLGKALAPAAITAANAVATLANKAGPLTDILGIKLAQAIDKSKLAYSELVSGITGKPIYIERERLITPFTQFGKIIHDLAQPLVQLAKAFSDLFRTITGANKMTASLQNIGQATETAKKPLEGLVNFVDTKLVPAITGATTFLNDHSFQIAQVALKAYDLYHALSPLAIIFDTIKGVINGGLNGGLSALGQHVVDLGKVFGIDLTGAVSGVINFIEQNLIPTFSDIAKWITGTLVPGIINFAQQAIPILVNAFNIVADFITTKVIPAIGGFAQFIITQVLPVLGQIGNFIVTQVVPAIGQFVSWIGDHLVPIAVSMVDTFINKVLPAVGQFAQWFTDKALPALGSFAQFIGDKVVPVVETIADVIATKIIPTVGDWVAFITSKVIPVLGDWIGILATSLKPVILAVGDFITTKLVPAISSVADFISNKAIPAFSGIADFIGSKVMPVLSFLAQYLGTNLASAFNQIAIIVSGVWNAITTTISTAWNTISGIFTVIGDVLSGNFGKAWDDLKATIGKAWDGVVSLIQNAWNTISGVFGNMVDAVKNTLGPAIDGLKPLFQGAFDAVGKAIDTVVGIWNGLIEKIQQGAKVIGDVARGDWGAAWNDLTGASQTNGDAISKIANTTRDNVVKALGEVGPKAGAAMEDAHNRIKSQDWSSAGYAVGKSVGDGMTAGVLSTAASMANAAASLVSKALASARAAGRISSPSKEAAEKVGKPISEGVALGILQGAKSVMNAVNSVMVGVTTEAMDAAVKQAETLDKVSTATKNIFDNLSKLKGYVQIGEGPIKDFGKDTFSLAAEFYNDSKLFTDKMLASTTAFADAVSKVGSATGAAFDALSKLKEYSAIGIDRIYAFGQDVFSLTAEFFNNSRYFTEEMLAATNNYSDTVAKVAPAASSAFDALSKLKDYSAIGANTIHAFGQDVDSLSIEFFNNSVGFTEEMLTSANNYSDTVSKIGSATSAAFGALSQLPKYVQVGATAIHTFGQDLLALSIEFYNNSVGFDAKMLTSASTYADAASKMVGVLGTGVQNFTSLQKYKKVASENIENFALNLQELVADTIKSAADFDAKAITATAAWGDSIGKLTTGLKNGMDLFNGLVNYKKVASTAIRAFVDDIHLTIRLASEMVKETDSDLMKQVGDFGDSTGKLFNGLKAAMDIFTSLEKFKSTPSNVIKQFVAEVIYTVGLAADMARKTDVDLLHQAQDFYDATGKIFGNIKGALDTFKALQEYKGYPSDTAQSLIAGIVDATGKMTTAVGKATEFRDKAVTYADRLTEAGNAIRRGAEAAARAASEAAKAASDASANGGSGSTPGYATGTGNHPGGPAWVGESGKPELIKMPSGTTMLVIKPQFFPSLPRGTKVFNPSQTSRMVQYPMSPGQQMMQTYNQQSYQNNYNLSLAGGQSTGSVMSDFAFMQLMG